MGSGGATRTSYVQLRDGSGGDSVGKNGLTPKKKGGGHRGIGIVEVLWKVCSVVVNCWLKSSVVLHHALHGFIEGRGTANMEANLAHQLAGFAHDTLFQVFLDVRKSYDSMDRKQCLELLRGY